MKSLAVALCCMTLALSSIAFAQKKSPPPPLTEKQKEERARLKKCVDEAEKQKIRERQQLKNFLAICNR
jgi:hypothetical protein